jgi:hypothetical protein
MIVHIWGRKERGHAYACDGRGGVYIYTQQIAESDRTNPNGFSRHGRPRPSDGAHPSVPKPLIQVSLRSFIQFFHGKAIPFPLMRSRNIIRGTHKSKCDGTLKNQLWFAKRKLNSLLLKIAADNCC